MLALHGEEIIRPKVDLFPAKFIERINFKGGGAKARELLALLRDEVVGDDPPMEHAWSYEDLPQAADDDASFGSVSDFEESEDEANGRTDADGYAERLAQARTASQTARDQAGKEAFIGVFAQQSQFTAEDAESFYHREQKKATARYKNTKAALVKAKPSTGRMLKLPTNRSKDLEASGGITCGA